MGYRMEYDCRGCAECTHCGRDRKKYIVYFCDKCKEETDELYELNNKELCFDCYKEHLISKVLDDCDDTVCAKCGYDLGELYLVDGEWLCSDCLKDMAERVDTEN